MATIKELEKQVTQLQERVNSLQGSNMRTRDELTELKAHYSRLVKGLNERLEAVDKQFRKS